MVVAFCALFVMTLQFTYANMDSQLFSFLGLVRREVSPTWAAIGIASAVAPALWMPIRLERPSMVAYWILYVTVIVPVQWIPYQTLSTDPSHYFPFAAMYLVCFFLLGLAFRLPRWNVPRPIVRRFDFWFVLGALTLAATLAVWMTSGFHLDLGIKSMYDRRRAAGESIPMGSFLSYIKGNLASALQPYVFAVGIAWRAWGLVLLSIFTGVVGFSVDGSKTSALIPVFLLGLYPLLTRYRRNFGLVMPLMAALLAILAFLGREWTHNPTIPVVTTWRLFDVKGLLTGYYFEFFSTGPKMLLSDGVLRGVFANPYQYAAPEQIGLHYFGSSQTNSNANLWASAFGDFGYFGMLLATAGLAFIFRLIDSMALNRGFLIPAFLASFLGMKLSDVALDTSMLSHGTLAVLVLIYFLPPLNPEASEAQDAPLAVATA